MKCRVCACTDLHACAMGCAWYCDELCTACEDFLPPDLELESFEDLWLFADAQVEGHGDMKLGDRGFELVVALLCERRRDLIRMHGREAVAEREFEPQAVPA